MTSICISTGQRCCRDLRYLQKDTSDLVQCPIITQTIFISISFSFSTSAVCLLGRSPQKQHQQNSYIKNTVIIANQLLDSIEKDVKISKGAVESKERYIELMEKENSTLRAQLIEAKVTKLIKKSSHHFIVSN
jgi:ABC-type hemin transport system ATPase subunit